MREMEGQFIQNSEMEGQIIHAVEFIHSDNVNTVNTELKHTNKMTVNKGHNRTCEMEGRLASSGKM